MWSTGIATVDRVCAGARGAHEGHREPSAGTAWRNTDAADHVDEQPEPRGGNRRVGHVTMADWVWMAVAVAVIATVVLLWRRRRDGDEAVTSRTVPAGIGGVTSQRGRSEGPSRTRRLSDDRRAHYIERWRDVERRRANQPATGLLEADVLLSDLLADVGYPVGSFEQRAQSVSATHAMVVDDYRVARCVALDARLGLAGTAEIHEAIRRYRIVFEHIAEADLSHTDRRAA